MTDMWAWIQGSGPELVALIQVILIDLVLAGDNAVVVGMAVAGLPEAQKSRAILIGIAVATVLRIGFALITLQLLAIVGLLLAGGVLLLWVCWKMFRELRPSAAMRAAHADGTAAPKTMRAAMIQIVLADLSMSLDNVLAVAGAAREHPWVMVVGLTVSVVLMGVAARLISALLEKRRWIAWVGAADRAVRGVEADMGGRARRMDALALAADQHGGLCDVNRTALIAGASGIVGQALAARLVADGWSVLGLARRPGATPGVKPVMADLMDAGALKAALAGREVSHVFITTWMRQATEAENIRVNGAMVRNLLDAVQGPVEHVGLVTGLKHYLGPFEAYGKGALPETPFREEQPRLDVENFYYAQEDAVFAAAARRGFGWSVHRPHTIIGYAVGNAMNMGVTLAAYASLCKSGGRPFLFPGSAVQWRCLTDMTDARLLARHLAWAATTPAARYQAFNVVNGDVFRWSWMWGRIAAWFGLEPAPLAGEGTPLEQQLAGAAPEWAALAARHGLIEGDLGRVASAWHTDADLGRPIEVVTDMGRSRRLGFLDYQCTDLAFFELFERLRAERVIP